MTDALVRQARDAALAAYAPYSGFRVGAAVLAGGQVFRGCNVECASYGLTVCAERNAIFAAIGAGHRRIDRIALACIDATTEGGAALMPCGACLQVIAEFADPDTVVQVDGAGDFTLRALLPNGFGLPRA